jgi:glutamyl-tRNA reductase
VAKVPGVVVYTIDEIQARTNEVLEKRLASIPAVKAIISHEMEGFVAWCRDFAISPVIQKFKDALEQIRQEELARYLKNADAKEIELVEKVTLSMMNKIVKLPALQLKAACKRGEEDTLIGVLNDLFNLEGVKTPDGVSGH